MKAPVLLEPRIMMDANLEWDLASSTALSGTLANIVQTFDEKFASFDIAEDSFGLSNQAHSIEDRSISHAVEPVHSGASDLQIERVKAAFADLRQAVYQDVNQPGDPIFDKIGFNVESLESISFGAADQDTDIGSGEEMSLAVESLEIVSFEESRAAETELEADFVLQSFANVLESVEFSKWRSGCFSIHMDINPLNF